MKVSEHIPSRFPMSPISLLKKLENNHDVDRSKDCIRNFCEPLREHAVRIISFKKKKMKIFTSKWEKLKKICIYEEKLEDKYINDKKIM